MSHLPSRAQIAQRMQQGLLREIGHEIQLDRLLTDPGYARDVLLVCDALADTDLAWLAPLFREATAALDTPAPRPRPSPAPAATPETPATAPTPPAAGSGPAQAHRPERRRGWRQG